MAQGRHVGARLRHGTRLPTRVSSLCGAAIGFYLGLLKPHGTVESRVLLKNSVSPVSHTIESGLVKRVTHPSTLISLQKKTGGRVSWDDSTLKTQLKNDPSETDVTAVRDALSQNFAAILGDYRRALDAAHPEASDGSDFFPVVVDVCSADGIAKQAENESTSAASTSSSVNINCDSVAVFGDTHGAFEDLVLVLSAIAGAGRSILDRDMRHHLVFNGDFVDRAAKAGDSFHVLFLLLWLKAKVPGKITLLRGNHEESYFAWSRNGILCTTPNTEADREQQAFFPDSLLRRGPEELKRVLQEIDEGVFQKLPFAAVVFDETFVVHAGVSRNLKTAKELRATDCRSLTHALPQIYKGETRPGPETFIPAELVDLMGNYEYKCPNELTWADLSLDKTDVPKGVSVKNGAVDTAFVNRCPWNWSKQVMDRWFDENAPIKMLIRGHHPIGDVHPSTFHQMTRRIWGPHGAARTDVDPEKRLKDLYLAEFSVETFPFYVDLGGRIDSDAREGFRKLNEKSLSGGNAPTKGRVLFAFSSPYYTGQGQTNLGSFVLLTRVASASSSSDEGKKPSTESENKLRPAPQTMFESGALHWLRPSLRFDTSPDNNIAYRRDLRRQIEADMRDFVKQGSKLAQTNVAFAFFGRGPNAAGEEPWSWVSKAATTESEEAAGDLDGESQSIDCLLEPRAGAAGGEDDDEEGDAAGDRNGGSGAKPPASTISSSAKKDGPQQKNQENGSLSGGRGAGSSKKVDE